MLRKGGGGVGGGQGRPADRWRSLLPLTTQHGPPGTRKKNNTVAWQRFCCAALLGLGSDQEYLSGCLELGQKTACHTGSFLGCLDRGPTLFQTLQFF